MRGRERKIAGEERRGGERETEERAKTKARARENEAKSIQNEIKQT